MSGALRLEMPDTSAGADDVARLAMWPSPRVIPRGDSFVGPKSGCRGPRDAQGERLSRARGFPGAQSEKQVNTVPLPICVSSHAKASFERENGGFSVEKTTRQRRGNPKLFAVFFRVIRATEILRARFFATTTDRPTIFYFFLRARYLTFQRVRFDAAATIRASRAYTYSNLDNTQPVQ